MHIIFFKLLKKLFGENKKNKINGKIQSKFPNKH